MSPVVLPSGSGSRSSIVSIRIRSAYAAAGLSPVVVIIVPVFFVAVVVAGVLGEYTRHHILHLCQHLLFAGL